MDEAKHHKDDMETLRKAEQKLDEQLAARDFTRNKESSQVTFRRDPQQITSFTTGRFFNIDSEETVGATFIEKTNNAFQTTFKKYYDQWNSELPAISIVEDIKKDEIENKPLYVIDDLLNKYNICNTNTILMLMGLISYQKFFVKFYDSHIEQGSWTSLVDNFFINIVYPNDQAHRDYISSLKIGKKLERDSLIYNKHKHSFAGGATSSSSSGSSEETKKFILNYTLIKHIKAALIRNTEQFLKNKNVIETLAHTCALLYQSYHYINLMHAYYSIAGKQLLLDHYNSMIKKNTSIFTYLKIRVDTSSCNPRYEFIINEAQKFLYMRYFNNENTLKYGSDIQIKDRRQAALNFKEEQYYYFGAFENIFTSEITNEYMAKDLYKKFKTKLQRYESMCIVGYGQSGAGKTSALVQYYGKGVITKGIIIDLLNIIGLDLKTHFNTITLESYNIYCKHGDKFNRDMYDHDYKEDIQQEFARESNQKYTITKYTINGSYSFDVHGKNWVIGEGENKRELNQDMNFLLKMREVEPTISNPDSSRSHLIIVVKLTKSGTDNESNIILCDLAGYETALKCMDDPTLDILRKNYNKSNKYNPPHEPPKLVIRDKYFDDQINALPAGPYKTQMANQRTSFEGLLRNYHEYGQYIDKIISITARIYTRFNTNSKPYYTFFIKSGSNKSDMDELPKLVDEMFIEIGRPSHSDTPTISSILTEKFVRCYGYMVDTYDYRIIIHHIHVLEQKTDKESADIIRVYNIFAKQIEDIFLDFIGYITLLNNLTNDEYMATFKPKYTEDFNILTIIENIFKSVEKGKCFRLLLGRVPIYNHATGVSSARYYLEGTDLGYYTSEIDSRSTGDNDIIDKHQSFTNKHPIGRTVNSDFSDTKGKNFINKIGQSGTAILFDVPMSRNSLYMNPMYKALTDPSKYDISDSSKLYGIMRFRMYTNDIIIKKLAELTTYLSCFILFDKYMSKNDTPMKYNCMLRNNESPNSALHAFYNDIKHIAKSKLYSNINPDVDDTDDTDPTYNYTTNTESTPVDDLEVGEDKSYTIQNISIARKPHIQDTTLDSKLYNNYTPIYSNKNKFPYCVNNKSSIDNYDDYYEFFESTDAATVYDKNYGIIMTTILQNNTKLNLINCNFIIFSFIDLSDYEHINNPPKPPYINISALIFISKYYKIELNSQECSRDCRHAVKQAIESLCTNLRKHPYYSTSSILSNICNEDYESAMTAVILAKINEIIKVININNSVTLIGILENSDNISNIQNNSIICDDNDYESTLVNIKREKKDDIAIKRSIPANSGSDQNFCTVMDINTKLNQRLDPQNPKTSPAVTHQEKLNKDYATYISTLEDSETKDILIELIDSLIKSNMQYN